VEFVFGEFGVEDQNVKNPQTLVFCRALDL
jgi:hypothetical protein